MYFLISTDSGPVPSGLSDRLTVVTRPVTVTTKTHLNLQPADEMSSLVPEVDKGENLFHWQYFGDLK